MLLYNNSDPVSFDELPSDPHQRYQIHYRNALDDLPPPGSGQFHPGMLRVAILGLRAGKSTERIYLDIRGVAKQGTRIVPDREIHDTIKTALKEIASSSPGGVVRVVNGLGRPEKSKPSSGETSLGLAHREKIIAEGSGTTVQDLMAAPPEDVANLKPWDFIYTLFEPCDILFIGSHYNVTPDHLKEARNWCHRFKEDGWAVPPHIIPNPLTGHAAKKKNSQELTYRGDGCVASYRYCVAEFDSDDMPYEKQIAFWAGAMAKLPIAALIDSAGKSIHAWIKVDLQSAEEWMAVVRRDLYPKYLIPMGVDPACRNESRLSRMPGYVRLQDDGSYREQKCIYLAPEVRPLGSPIDCNQKKEDNT